MIHDGHGGTHPVGLLGIGAEFIRIPEAVILCGDLPPHVPSAARLDFPIETGAFFLASDGGVFHTAAVGDEYQVVFRQHDCICFSVLLNFNGSGGLFGICDSEPYIDHLYPIMEQHTMSFKIPGHRKDHGFILVILRKAQSCEIRQAADMMYKPLHIQFHFQRGVPVLKSKHRTPVQPEIGTKHFVIKNVRNPLIVQLFIRGQVKLHQLPGRLIRKAEFLIRMGIFTPVFCCPAQGKVRILLVQPIILIQDGNPFRFYRGN